MFSCLPKTLIMKCKKLFNVFCIQTKVIHKERHQFSASFYEARSQKSRLPSISSDLQLDVVMTRLQTVTFTVIRGPKAHVSSQDAE